MPDIFDALAEAQAANQPKGDIFDQLPDLPAVEDNGKGRLRSAAASFGQELGAAEGQVPSAVARVLDTAKMHGADQPSPYNYFQNMGEIARMKARTPAQREAEIATSPLGQLGQTIKENAELAYTPNPKYRGEFWADQFPRGAASTAVPLVAGIVAGPIGAAATYGLQSGQQGVEAANEAGRPDQADAAFLGYAVTGAATEAFLGVPARIWKIVKAARVAGVKPQTVFEGIKAIAKEGLKDGVYEATQESLEQVLQNAIDKQLHSPEKPIMEGVPESAAIGGLMGVGMGGGGHAVGRLSRGLERKARLNAVQDWRRSPDYQQMIQGIAQRQQADEITRRIMEAGQQQMVPTGPATITIAPEVPTGPATVTIAPNQPQQDQEFQDLVARLAEQQPSIPGVPNATQTLNEPEGVQLQRSGVNQLVQGNGEDRGIAPEVTPQGQQAGVGNQLPNQRGIPAQGQTQPGQAITPKQLLEQFAKDANASTDIETFGRIEDDYTAKLKSANWSETDKDAAFKILTDTWKRLRNEWLDGNLSKIGKNAIGVKMVSIKNPSDYWVVSQSVKPQYAGQWQATRFDARGPAFDTVFKSLDEAVRSLSGSSNRGPSDAGIGEYKVEKVYTDKNLTLPKDLEDLRGAIGQVGADIIARNLNEQQQAKGGEINAQGNEERQGGKEVLTPTGPANGPSTSPVQNQPSGIRQGKVGDMLASGEVVLTSSGRKTTPFPAVNVDTERKAANTIKKVEAWLQVNALAEAESRGDEFNAQQFKSENPGKIPQASKDAMEEYLFGQQPVVPPSILKPVNPQSAPTPVQPKPAPQPTVAAEEKPAERMARYFAAMVPSAYNYIRRGIESGKTPKDAALAWAREIGLGLQDETDTDYKKERGGIYTSAYVKGILTGNLKVELNAKEFLEAVDAGRQEGIALKDALLKRQQEMRRKPEQPATAVVKETITPDKSSVSSKESIDYDAKIEEVRNELPKLKETLEKLQGDLIVEKWNWDKSYNKGDYKEAERINNVVISLEAQIRQLATRIENSDKEIYLLQWEKSIAPYYGQKAPEPNLKITPKELKTHKDFLLSELKKAIQAAPDEGKDKIVIDVPGDGKWTIWNNKPALKKFYSIAEKGMPTTVTLGGGASWNPEKKKSIKQRKAKSGELDAEDLVKVAGNFTSEDQARYSINYVYADGTQIVATDGKQLIRIVSNKSPGSPTSPVRIDADGEIDEDAGKSNFPNWKIVRDPQAEMIYGGADAAMLFQIAKQAKVFLDASVSEKDKRVNYGMDLLVNPDRSFAAKMEIIGDSFEENLQPGAKPLGTYYPEFLLNAMDAALKLGNSKVDLYAHSGETGPLGVVGQNHESLVMPMRLGNKLLRAPSNELIATTGRKNFQIPPEGYGPLENPEALRSRTVEGAKGYKYNVVLEDGVLKFQEWVKPKSEYGNPPPGYWKYLGDAKAWPTEKKEQIKVIEPFISDKETREKIRKTVNDLFGERQSAIDEIERRKKNPLPLEGETSESSPDYSDVLDRPQYSTEQVLNAIVLRTTNPFYRRLAQLLIDREVFPRVRKTDLETAAKEMGIASIKPGTWGMYNAATDTVYVFDAANQERTLLHEFLHAGTLAALQDDPTFRAEIQALLEEAQDRAKGKEMYGLKSVEEFVSEAFTNTNFQNFLAQPNQRGLFQRIIDAIARFFGIKTEAEKTLLQRVVEAVEPRIAPDVEPERAGTFSMEASPEATAQAQQENAKPRIQTQIMGGIHYVLGREELNEAAIQNSIQYAEQIFAEAGVKVRQWQEMDARRNQLITLWEFDDSFEQNVEGARLVQILRRELRAYREQGKHSALLSSLLCSIRAEFARGRMETIFNRQIRNELYQLAQAEASRRGMELGALSQFSINLSYVAANVDVMLNKLYFDRYGGATVEEVLADISRRFSADPDVQAGIQGNLELQQFIDRIMELNRQDEGGRVYRRVQGLLKPKRAKTRAKLESDARVEEAVKELLAQAQRQGIEPKKAPTRPLSALEQMLLLVTPENAEKVDQLIRVAVEDAENAAGWKALQNRVRAGEITQEDLDNMRAADERPSPEDIAAGLELPEFSHWKDIRDNLLGYEPVTLKLVQQVINGDYKGTRFNPAKPKVADTRIDLYALAKQPDVEVARLLNAYTAEIGNQIDIAGATDETRMRIQQMVYEQVQNQIELARKRMLDNFFEPKKIKPPSASNRLQQLLNMGITRDPRFQNGKVRDLVARITGSYLDAKELRAIAQESQRNKISWMVSIWNDIVAKENLDLPELGEDGADYLRGVVWTTLAEKLGDAERSIINGFLKQADIDYTKTPATPEDKEKAMAEAIAKLQGQINAGVLVVPSVEEIARKSSIQKLVPNFTQLMKEVFETPFYRQDELKERFAEMLVGKLNIDPASSDKAWEIFNRAFGKKFTEARVRAVKALKDAMMPQEQRKIGASKKMWQVIERLANTGALDSGTVLQELAKAHGWTVPTAEEIAKLKELAGREQKLKELSPKDIENARLDGITPEQALANKEAFYRSELAALKKEMQLRWAKMSKPIVMPWESLQGYWATRQNAAIAMNELTAANLLTKVGFATRQVASVVSQAIFHVNTRAIGQALVLRSHAGNYNPAAFWEDYRNLSSASLKALKNGIWSGLYNARASMAGRAESKNVDHILSGIAALDRIEAKAKEYEAKGEKGKATLLWMATQIKWGYRIAASMDYIHGTPSESQELAMQVYSALVDKGVERGEAKAKADAVIGDINMEWAEAMALVKLMADRDGVELSPKQITEKAAAIIEERQFTKARELNVLPDGFEDQIDYLRNTIGWNEQETTGPGGVVARVAKGAQAVMSQPGIPLPFGAFGNAIAISINRSLHFTPFYALTNAHLPGSPKGDSPWFKTESDRMQRRVEFVLGTTLGGMFFFMAWMGGFMRAFLRPPQDKEERELWEQAGHKAGTAEFYWGDGTFTPISINASFLTPFAPYIAAGAALHDLMERREKAQAKLDKDAAKLGLAAGRINPINFGDLMGVAAEAAWNSVMGGSRTAAGLIGSITDYGSLPNSQKAVASYLSPMVFGLPAFQEIERMNGVVLDQKLASVWDFMVPLPSSGARKLNLLGEPAGTPDDLQRIVQTLTGGTYPLVSEAQARSSQAYQSLFSSGYRPPSIDPNKGYNMNGTLRPMTKDELVKYTEERGKSFRQNLIGLGATDDPDAVKRAYQSANTQALQAVGASPGREEASGGVGTAGGQSSAPVGQKTSGASPTGRPAPLSQSMSAGLPTGALKPVIRRPGGFSQRTTLRRGLRGLRGLGRKTVKSFSKISRGMGKTFGKARRLRRS